MDTLACPAGGVLWVEQPFLSPSDRTSRDLGVIRLDSIDRRRRELLDGVSLDQLRTFIAAADEGSFSAAGRRLRRAQSVVSQTLANLEGQLGVKLFDRRGRCPTPTDQGRPLLAHARRVPGNADPLHARAK